MSAAKAVAFLAKQIPVATGDECLLFLARRPSGWGILKWHVQFKRSADIPPRAASLAEAGAGRFVRPEWLGPSVGVAEVDGRITPDWEALVIEVKRAGALGMK